MSTSFQNIKDLIFTITLAQGSFSATGNNTITLRGIRATADIDKAGGQMMPTARFKLYGLSQQLNNQLTTLAWRAFGVLKNTIQVQAVDGDQVTTVYAGNIINAWADYAAAPDVYLYIESQACFFAAISSAPAASYKGAVDVATVMKTLAGKLGLTFENNGVSVMLANPYFPSTYTEQARAAAIAANIDLYIDDTVLAICPRGGFRAQGSKIPLISPQSGLVGYPKFDKIGITFDTLFNPGVLFGGRVQVQSSIQQACGTWGVSSMSHRLSSAFPGGPWFSSIRCTETGLVIN